MTNDAKLGLLAGVAGVVTAAVFHRPTPDAPAPPAQAVVSAQPAAPPRVAGAVPAPRVAGAEPATRAASTVPRPEVEARTVSRAVDDED